MIIHTGMHVQGIHPFLEVSQYTSIHTGLKGDLGSLLLCCGCFTYQQCEMAQSGNRFITWDFCLPFKKLTLNIFLPITLAYTLISETLRKSLRQSSTSLWTVWPCPQAQSRDFETELLSRDPLRWSFPMLYSCKKLYLLCWGLMNLLILLGNRGKAEH